MYVINFLILWNNLIHAKISSFWYIYYLFYFFYLFRATKCRKLSSINYIHIMQPKKSLMIIMYGQYDLIEDYMYVIKFLIIWNNPYLIHAKISSFWYVMSANLISFKKISRYFWQTRYIFEANRFENNL